MDNGSDSLKNVVPILWVLIIYCRAVVGYVVFVVSLCDTHYSHLLGILRG